MNADPIYNQYKDMYAKQGQQAMMDTMGNAASLTGGYGSSYASTAGNQAYQAYLQQLNNVVPDLANNAYGRYRDEGNDMYNQMGLLQGMDSTDYGKHRDSIGDYYTDLNYQYGKTRDMSQEEYNKYVNDLNAWQSDRGYYYGKSQDEQSQQNWQTQWDYQLAQDAQASKGGGGGRSSGGSGSSSGSLSDIEAEARRLYQSDPDSAYAFLSSTGVSDAQANAIIRKFNDLTKGWEVEIGAMDLAKKPTKKIVKSEGVSWQNLYMVQSRNTGRNKAIKAMRINILQVILWVLNMRERQIKNKPLYKSMDEYRKSSLPYKTIGDYRTQSEKKVKKGQEGYEKYLQFNTDSEDFYNRYKSIYDNLGSLPEGVYDEESYKKAYEGISQLKDAQDELTYLRDTLKETRGYFDSSVTDPSMYKQFNEQDRQLRALTKQLSDTPDFDYKDYDDYFKTVTEGKFKGYEDYQKQLDKEKEYERISEIDTKALKGDVDKLKQQYEAARQAEEEAETLISTTKDPVRSKEYWDKYTFAKNRREKYEKELSPQKEDLEKASQYHAGVEQAKEQEEKDAFRSGLDIEKIQGRQ